MLAGGYRWRGDRYGSDLAEEEPARSRRAGRRSNSTHAWQDPALAAAGAIIIPVLSDKKKRPFVLKGLRSRTSSGRILPFRFLRDFLRDFLYGLLRRLYNFLCH